MKRAMAGPRGMTKAQALREFNQLCPRSSFLKMFTNGREQLDTIARDQAWNNFTSGLCEDGRITVEQHEGWSNPWRER